MDSYEKIVMSGGSSKGFAFIGILEFLQENKMIENVQEITGCSIGAFAGMLFLLGYESKMLKKIFSEYDLDGLKKFRVGTFFKNFGLDNGSKVDKFIKIFIKNKNLDEGISLKEFYEKTQKRLICVVTNVNTRKTEFISIDTFPNIPLYLAVKMSMCIPFIYEPVKFNNNYYVDGGLTCNFPVRYYTKDCDKEDDKKKDDKILCLCFEEKNKNEELVNFEDYLYNILKSSFNTVEAIDKEYAKNQGFDIITIMVSIHTNFNLNFSNSVKEELYKAGYESIKTFFENKKGDA